MTGTLVVIVDVDGRSPDGASFSIKAEVES